VLLPDNLTSQLFSETGSLVAVHQQFTAELEDRLSSWEGRGEKEAFEQNADDILLRHILALKVRLLVGCFSKEWFLPICTLTFLDVWAEHPYPSLQRRIGLR